VSGGISRNKPATEGSKKRKQYPDLRSWGTNEDGYYLDGND
jgi:hypothetical protein